MESVDRLQQKANLRAKVAEVMYEAITRTALENNLGAVNAQAAMRAVDEALARDVALSDAKALREIAEHAVEASFAALGFDSGKVLADFYIEVEKRLPETV